MINKIGGMKFMPTKKTRPVDPHNLNPNKDPDVQRGIDNYFANRAANHPSPPNPNYDVKISGGTAKKK